MTTNQVIFRCDDGQEAAIFSQYLTKDGKYSYELSIEDSYIGGGYQGFFGRVKRAWHAFKAKPVIYTGVFYRRP